MENPEWNVVMSFSMPRKSWNSSVAHGMSWKKMEKYFFFGGGGGGGEGDKKARNR